jgi:hypothetical protein
MSDDSMAALAFHNHLHRASKFQIEAHAPSSHCILPAEQEHATIRKRLKTASMTNDNDVIHTVHNKVSYISLITLCDTTP